MAGRRGSSFMRPHDSTLLTFSQQARQIELPGENLDAVGCFLEYLYTGDYFPKKLAGQRALEADPSVPSVDESGEQLLKHARVYTLAEKFGVDKLKTLASSKIHCVNSTAKGEITYARYVYQYTSKADSTVRAPVANFWATRSHTLRAEAEAEFRSLCLEFPEFGYDVLSKPSLASFSLLSPRAVTDLSQPVFSTKSSSAKRTRKCTPPRPAAGSVPGTAMCNVFISCLLMYRLLRFIFYLLPRACVPRLAI